MDSELKRPKLTDQDLTLNDKVKVNTAKIPDVKNSKIARDTDSDDLKFKFDKQKLKQDKHSSSASER